MNENIRRNHLETYGSSLTTLLNVYNYELRIGPTKEDSCAIKETSYLCPLCLKCFFYIKENEVFESNEFTEDHFPPKSVGGTRTILVCITCNSSYGRNLDYAIKEYLEFMRFVKKTENSSYPTKLSFGGIPGKYNQNVRWENRTLVKEIDFKKYPLIKKWIFDYEKIKKGFSLKLSSPSEKTIQRALLRVAYLYCFQNWGYDFCFSQTAHRLRNVIDGKEVHPLSNFGVFNNVSMPSFSNGFYFNDSSATQATFIILFDIKVANPKYEQKIVVLIPGGDLEAWSRLSNFESWIEKGETDLSLVQLFEDSIMRNNHFGYSLTWQKLSVV